MAAVIFSGNHVKALKNAIRLSNEARIASGSADPTLGFPAETGSIYLRTNGEFYRKTGALDTDWAQSGSGTVTSVGLSLPSIFNVTVSPITVSGDLTAVLATQTANTVFAGPDIGSPAAPTFRALVAADIPTSSLDHNALNNLAVGDVHTQYAAILGRAGGQVINGGTASGENLTLVSTTNATKGKIIFGSNSAFDQVNTRLGIGTASPSNPFVVTHSTNSVSNTAYLENTSTGNSAGTRLGLASSGGGLAEFTMYASSHATLPLALIALNFSNGPAVFGGGTNGASAVARFQGQSNAGTQIDNTGTSGFVAIRTGSTPTEAVRVNSSQQTVFKSSIALPSESGWVTSTINALSNGADVIASLSRASADTGAADIRFFKSRGSHASKATVATNDIVMNLGSYAYDSTVPNYILVAGYETFIADGATRATSHRWRNRDASTSNVNMILASNRQLQLSMSAGTASVPIVTDQTDTNTGWWFPAADTQAWSTGGTERMRLSTTDLQMSANITMNSGTSIRATAGELTLTGTSASGVVIEGTNATGFVALRAGGSSIEVARATSTLKWIVGSNLTLPTQAGFTAGRLQILGDNGADALIATSFAQDAVNGPEYRAYKSRGGHSSKTAVVANDSVMSLIGAAYETTTPGYSDVASYSHLVESISGATIAGYHTWSTRNSSNAFAERMRLTSIGVLRTSMTAGTAALPAIADLSDTNTGWWFPAADTQAWSTNGSEKLRLTSAGSLRIGSPLTGLTGNQLLIQDNDVPTLQGWFLGKTGANGNAAGEPGGGMQIMSFRNDGNGTFGARLGLGHFRADGTAIGANVVLGRLMFGGVHTGSTTYTAANHFYSAQILATSAEAWTGASNIGSNLLFFTAPTATASQGGLLNGTTFGTERLRITSQGYVQIGNQNGAASSVFPLSVRNTAVTTQAVFGNPFVVSPVAADQTSVIVGITTNQAASNFAALYLAREGNAGIYLTQTENVFRIGDSGNSTDSQSYLKIQVAGGGGNGTVTIGTSTAAVAHVINGVIQPGWWGGTSEGKFSAKTVQIANQGAGVNTIVTGGAAATIGSLFVVQETAGGRSAVFLIGAAATVLVAQDGASFSTTPDNNLTSNVFISGNEIRVQNRSGVSNFYRMMLLGVSNKYLI